MKRNCEWPLRCREAAKKRGTAYRVIKGIHPTVPSNLIKAQLLRNGVAVEEVSHLYSTRGGGDSYYVKVKFIGNIPSTVPYAGEQRTVHPYEPQVSSQICLIVPSQVTKQFTAIEESSVQSVVR